jgi:chaperonin GroES
MHVRPLHDRILVQPLDVGEQHIGGIAAGGGKVRDDGDTILFGTYAGQDSKLDGLEYLIMKEEKVLAAIKGVAVKVATTKTATTKADTGKKGR